MNEALTNQLRDSPLEDLVRIAMSQEPAPDGQFQNVVAAIQVRGAIESSKAAVAATETAKWTRKLAWATFTLAAATVGLAIATVVVH